VIGRAVDVVGICVSECSSNGNSRKVGGSEGGISSVRVHCVHPTEGDVSDG
jgi:hypothetical protein